MRCFMATGRARVSLCEANRNLAAQVAARYGVQQVFDNLSAALEIKADVCVICTPAHLHVVQAAAALQAGSHVLIEKPLGVSLSGVSELTSLVEETGLNCGVAYVYRAHPVLAEMRTAIQSGRFGQPIQLTALAGQHFPFYRPAYKDTYYRDHRTGGGAVQDALTHVINAAEWLVGPAESVVADVARLALPGVEVEDTAHVLARHGAVLACYSLNQHQAPNEMTITIACESGTVRFEYHENRWRSAAEPGGGWSDHPGVPLERDTLFTRQASVFLDAAGGEGRPLCSLEEGLQTLRVNLAVLESARQKQWLDVSRMDPVA